MDAFDLVNNTVNSGKDFSNYTLVLITAAYFVLVRFLGDKGIFDPLYIRKCSAGSLVEICKIMPDCDLPVKVCVFWKASISLLTATTYLNISGVIIGKILATNVPSDYTNILITIFLLAAGVAYISKLFMSALILIKKDKYCSVKVVDCFW